MLTQQEHIMDTIGTVPVRDTILSQTPSLFAGNELLPTHQLALPRSAENVIWPAVVLFIGFCLFVFAQTSEPKKFWRILVSTYSLQSSKQLQREDYKLGKRLSVVLIILFIITFSFLAYIINNYFGLILNKNSEWGKYLIILGIITGTYVFKYLFSLFVSYLINASELVKEYMFNAMIYSQVMGITLFPLVIIIQYSRLDTVWLLYPAIAIFLFFYTFRMVRGFIISWSENGVGILYIFLYFCALEILPLLVFIKFLLSGLN